MVTDEKKQKDLLDARDNIPEYFAGVRREMDRLVMAGALEASRCRLSHLDDVFDYIAERARLPGVEGGQTIYLRAYRHLRFAWDVGGAGEHAAGKTSGDRQSGDQSGK